MREPRGLIGDCGDDRRIRVADVERADAADEIDVAPAVDVPDDGALAPVEEERMGRSDAAGDAFLATLQQRAVGGN